ncbi:MAG: cupin domain-containing protein [Acidovorax sp.]|jgi:transcriptional regulator with XRE-family HTH domain|nr:cupin domain-containing protein [Acidovorax sp.]MDR3006027.1 cupin domain-containing protein [Acidovorax sp.]
MDRVKKSVAPADPALDESRRRLGVKLKLARQAKNLTLRKLAEQSQCSESLLSKIENGKALPSLSLVHRLVRVLESNVSWLFDETEPDDGPVYPAGKRPLIPLERKRGAGGVTFERIIPFKGGHLLECTIHHIEVGGQSGAAISHEGEEVGYVLCGHAELILDGVSYELKAGDAFSFRSHLPHSYRNIGKERASIYWVCTPPTF